MHRTHALLAAVVMTAALAAPAAAAEPATRYIALGDSLAWGDGASDPATTAYVPLLADYFAGTAHAGAKQMVNLAIRGETTDSLIERELAQAVALIDDPKTDTRVVTISIGGNDLLNLINDPDDACVIDFASPACQGLMGSAMAGVQANLPVIFGTLQAALARDPGPEKLFVLLPYSAFSGTGSPFEPIVAGGLRGADGAFDCGALGNVANVGLDDVIGCTAATMGAIPVDSYPYFEGRGLQLTHIGEGFNIHPNDAGYALIAKAHRLANQ
ncbi:MAG TPA: SGNH/GDSL hydrolase family protein [Candidatus Limnocylindrales bacterium]